MPNLPMLSDVVLAEYEAGKDELNMAEYPLSLAGKTLSGRHRAKVSFSDVIRDKGTGQTVQRTVSISGDEELGLPTYYDEEVLFGILQLTHLNRSASGAWPKQVTFTRYQLARLLGLQPTGPCYRRLRDSLNRLASTTYRFEYSFFDKRDEEWKPGVTINFIQTVKFAAGGHDGRGLGDVSLTWNDDIHQNFEAGYLRDINFLEYRAMGLPLAKALFRFLGKHFWRSRQLTYDLRTLAHEKLGLSRDYDIGQIKRALTPALRRLEDRGYIVAMPPGQRYRKLSKGVWRIHFELADKAGKGSRGVGAAAPPDEPVLVPTDLERRLTEQGISRGTAAELVADFPPDLIERKLDVLAWMDEQRRPPDKSRPGFLAKSIRDAWSDPEGFVTAEARERQRQEQEAARAAAAEVKREQKRARSEYQRASAAREEAGRARLNALTEAELSALTREALGDSPTAFQLKHVKTYLIPLLIERLEAEGAVPPLPPEPDDAAAGR